MKKQESFVTEILWNGDNPFTVRLVSLMLVPSLHCQFPASDHFPLRWGSALCQGLLTPTYHVCVNLIDPNKGDFTFLWPLLTFHLDTEYKICCIPRAFYFYIYLMYVKEKRSFFGAGLICYCIHWNAYHLTPTFSQKSVKFWCDICKCGRKGPALNTHLGGRICLHPTSDVTLIFSHVIILTYHGSYDPQLSLIIYTIGLMGCFG